MKRKLSNQERKEKKLENLSKWLLVEKTTLEDSLEEVINQLKISGLIIAEKIHH